MGSRPSSSPPVVDPRRRATIFAARDVLKMSCPHCAESGSSVVRSRGAIVKDEVHRRRRCAFCGGRFPTAEQVDLIAFAKEQNLPLPPTWDDFERHFHEAWGHAKAGDPYVKQDWLAWQEILNAIKKTDPGAPHHRDPKFKRRADAPDET